MVNRDEKVVEFAVDAAGAGQRLLETLTPARGYDGALYIDTVTPPEYR